MVMRQCDPLLLRAIAANSSNHGQKSPESQSFGTRGGRFILFLN